MPFYTPCPNMWLAYSGKKQLVHTKQELLDRSYWSWAARAEHSCSVHISRLGWSGEERWKKLTRRVTGSVAVKQFQSCLTTRKHQRAQLSQDRELNLSPGPVIRVCKKPFGTGPQDLEGPKFLSYNISTHIQSILTLFFIVCWLKSLIYIFFYN